MSPCQPPLPPLLSFSMPSAQPSFRSSQTSQVSHLYSVLVQALCLAGPSHAPWPGSIPQVSAQVPLLPGSLPGVPGERESLWDPSLGFPVPMAASNPHHSQRGMPGSGDQGSGGGLCAAENQQSRVTGFSCCREHPARRKEAMSITPPVPQQSCQPDGPPSQHSCCLAERNFSPPGTGWGHSRWGHGV